MKILGPYYRKDGRQHVIIITNDGKRRTVSYPKYLVEQKLGRKLDPDLETIDHIDGDFTNNSFENLRIIERSKHAKEDSIHVESIEIICIYCGNKAMKRGRSLRASAKQGKSGPFCGKSCTGKYGAELQNGRQEKLGRINTSDPVYYKLKKQ